jgi:regulator of sigma E protease
LAASSKRVRASVLLAGPTINVVLGFIAFVLAFKMFAPDPNQVLITDIVPDSPADRAGILVGDLVRAVDASPITTFESMQIAISERESESVTIELQRDEQTLVVDLVPRIEYPPDQGPIGVTLGHPARATSWIEATSAGWDSIRLQVGAILSLPGRIISGVAEPEETRISGLKGIHDMLAWATSIDRTAQRPFLTLNIIGVISIGLAIANLLPFPALDGGRLVFIGIEFVLGRRISPQYESLAHAIGFILLLVLMVYFNLQDFINPIVLPR